MGRKRTWAWVWCGGIVVRHRLVRLPPWAAHRADGVLVVGCRRVPVSMEYRSVPTADVVSGNAVGWYDPGHGLGPMSFGGSLAIWHAVVSGLSSGLLVEGPCAAGPLTIGLLAKVASVTALFHGNSAWQCGSSWLRWLLLPGSSFSSTAELYLV